MEISGSYTLYAPRERVWSCLLDPAVLKGAIPGCEQLVQTADDQYRIRLRIAVAAVKGVGIYESTLRLTERHELDQYHIAVEGSGMRSVVRGGGTVTLEARAPSTTVVTYQGEAQLDGAIAGVGRRLAGVLARRLINHFFARVADVLAGETPTQPTQATGAVEPASVTARPIPAFQPASEWTPGLPEARPLEAVQPEALALPLAPRTQAQPVPVPMLSAMPPSAGLAGSVAMPAFLTQFVRRAGLSDGTKESEQRLAWGVAIAGGVALMALAAGLGLLAIRIRDQ